MFVMSFRGVTAAVLLLLSPLVAVTGPATPAAAADACREPATVAATESAAHKLATTCRREVDVLAETSETTKVVALPSGEFRMESSAEPQRVRRAGSWVPIDPNLKPGADGRLRPGATLADVEFSPGEVSGPFATMTQDGVTFSLEWPRKLPRGTVSGDTITYPNVYQDVDLAVRATSGGFSHTLVVHSARGATHAGVRETVYKVGGNATVAATHGVVTVSGPGGPIAATPPAIAWDSAPVPAALSRNKAVPQKSSSVREPGTAARRTGVDVSLAGRAMTVKVDRTLLDSAHFPLYIDPTYDRKWQKWIPVNDNRPGTSWTSGSSWPREDVRVGSNFESTGDIWRAHFQFDITALKGKRLTGTPSVDGYVEHSAWCGGEKLSIWQTSPIDGNTPTWNGMKGKWLHGAALQTKTVKANSACSGQKPAWVKFDGAAVKTRLKAHMDTNYTTITFGLRVPTESGGHWLRLSPDKINLKATYAHKPTSPVATRMVPGGNCAKTSPGPWINSRTPAVYGKASDGDGTVKIRYDVTGPTTPPDATSTGVKSGTERGWTTPSLAEGGYKWRILGTDDVDNTAWTPYCHFRLDFTGPAAPQVTRVSGTPVTGQPVKLKLTSSDALSGMKLFAYGVDEDAKEHTQVSTGTAEISFVPAAGRTQVYVWAQDNALNYSTRVTFNFFTGRITDISPQGAWRFSGDLRDDSGAGHDLAATAGVALGPDKAGVANGALTFDGVGCAQATPLLRSDAEYTVAAWVKLADKAASRTVLAFGGGAGASFKLVYGKDTDRWEALLSSADSGTPTWTAARNAAPPVAGTWYHLAATVDPVAKVLRLYVGGQLAGEAAITVAPWHAAGRFLLGCTGSAKHVAQQLAGTIDMVGVWQGLLSDQQIARAATELPAGPAAHWQLIGTGADATGHGYDLIVPGTTTTPPDDPDVPSESDNQKPGEEQPEPPGGENPEPPQAPDDPPNPDHPGEQEPDEPQQPQQPEAQPPAPPAPNWVDDHYGRVEAAWNTQGNRCATTTGPVLRTDESFSVGAWVRITDGMANTQAVLAQDGIRLSGFNLGVRDGRWSFSMKDRDDESVTSRAALSEPGSAAGYLGKWVHLVGAYDATARTVSLYVDGRLAQTTAAGPTPWHAAGPTTVGCARYESKAVDHVRGAISDARVWRGALTAQQVANVHGGNPGVTLEGSWSLDGPDSDEPTYLEDGAGKGRHLTVRGTYTWERDRGMGRDGALGLQLAAGSCAETTTGPAVRTDGSLTVSAWVLLTRAGGGRTVVSQAGTQRGGFLLEYASSPDRWRFALPAADTTNAALAGVTSKEAPALNTWTHLAGVYDLAARKVRLYVNGELQGEAAGPATPWMAAGQTLIGCTGTVAGARSAPLGDVVDDVRIWTSTVHPDRLADLAGN